MKTLKVCVIFLILFILIFNLSWSKSKRIEKIGRSHIFSEKTKLPRPIYKGHSNPFLFSQGGPNGYGYTYLDSDDVEGPTYNWIEISSGTPVYSYQWYSRLGYYPLDDGTAGPFSIGFDFVYNGQTFDSIYIGTNGAISFTHDTLTDDGWFYNAWIPGMKFSNVLAPFWNDLNLDPGAYGGGTVYYWTNAALDTFIVEYKNVKPYAEASTPDAVTFELILTSRDSSITFQYFSVKTPNTIAYGEPAHLDSFALIGIQDYTRYFGLRYYGMGLDGYENLPDSGLAIKFKKTTQITHNVAPKKILAYDYPHDDYDQISYLFYYVEETGTSFSDNSVKVLNLAENQETNISVICDVSRKDSLGNSVDIYSVSAFLSDISSQDSVEVPFPNSWVPMERGSYIIKYSTDLSTDQVLLDDTIKGLIYAERTHLISPWSGTVPSCDGVINDTEWNDANRYDISRFVRNPYVIGWYGVHCYDSSAAIMYIKNDSNYFYIALDIPQDTTDTEYDGCLIGIDDTGDSFFASDSSEGRLWVDNHSIASDSLFFGHLISDPSSPYNYVPLENRGLFVPISGWEFGFGTSSGHQQFEIKIPFGTDPKWKLNSQPGNTILLFVDCWDRADSFSVYISGVGWYTLGNDVGYWPFSSVYDYTPFQLGRIYLSDAPSVPDKPILVFPPNGTEGAVDQAFLWEPALRATSYQLQIDDDSTFANSLIIDTTVTTNGCFVTDLPDTSIWWRVRGINSYGEGPWSDSAKYTDIEFPTDETDDLVAKFSLSQNYPNPFNPATTIPFTVHGSRKTVNSPVHTTQKSIYGSQLTVNSPIHTTLTIYNILGQRVKTLVDEDKLPGEYKIIWDGKDDKGNSVSSGIYFYRLKAGEFTEVKKMLLIK